MTQPLNPDGLPPTIQCMANSRRAGGKGHRCPRPAIRGAAVCHHHGGAAPQVRRRAAQRVVDMQLEALAAKLARQESIPGSGPPPPR